MVFVSIQPRLEARSNGGQGGEEEVECDGFSLLSFNAIAVLFRIQFDWIS